MEEKVVSTVAAATQEERVQDFANVLKRNTLQIKADRATEIAEVLETESKRGVEDLERELKKLIRKKKSALDMSPDNTYTIMKVKDFDPIIFLEHYNGLGLQIREIKIKLNVARETYNELFGKTYELETII